MNTDLDELSDADNLLAIWRMHEDFLQANHLLIQIIAKQQIFHCCYKSIRPSLRIIIFMNWKVNITFWGITVRTCFNSERWNYTKNSLNVYESSFPCNCVLYCTRNGLLYTFICLFHVCFIITVYVPVYNFRTILYELFQTLVCNVTSFHFCQEMKIH